MGSRGRVRPLAVVGLAALALVACTPTPGPSPSPTPSLTASPPETEAQKQRRLDFAAAETAYRTFRAEVDRVLIDGGASKATKVMLANAGNGYLTDFSDLAADYKTADARRIGSIRVAWVHQGAYSAAEVNLEVCEDATKVETFVGKKSLGFSENRTADLTVRRVGTSWKVWTGTGRKVKTCAT